MRLVSISLKAIIFFTIFVLLNSYSLANILQTENTHNETIETIYSHAVIEKKEPISLKNETDWKQCNEESHFDRTIPCQNIEKSVDWGLDKKRKKDPILLIAT